MSADATLTFRLPQEWTLRKLVNVLVQEWLPPFRAEPAVKAARWVVQAVMESNGPGESPLWEPGISTAEYESRVDRVVQAWVVRATAGRGKGNILARLAVSPEDPSLIQLTSPQATFPETLFDAAKIEAFVQSQGAGDDGFFAALLAEHGIKRA